RDGVGAAQQIAGYRRARLFRGGLSPHLVGHHVELLVAGGQLAPVIFNTRFFTSLRLTTAIERTFGSVAMPARSRARTIRPSGAGLAGSEQSASLPLTASSGPWLTTRSASSSVKA